MQYIVYTDKMCTVYSFGQDNTWVRAKLVLYDIPHTCTIPVSVVRSVLAFLSFDTGEVRHLYSSVTIHTCRGTCSIRRRHIQCCLPGGNTSWDIHFCHLLGGNITCPETSTTATFWEAIRPATSTAATFWDAILPETSTAAFLERVFLRHRLSPSWRHYVTRR